MAKKNKKYIPVERGIAEEMIDYFKSNREKGFDLKESFFEVHLQMQIQAYENESFDNLFSKFLKLAREKIERERNPTPQVEDVE